MRKKLLLFVLSNNGLEFLSRGNGMWNFNRNIHHTIQSLYVNGGAQTKGIPEQYPKASTNPFNFSY